MSCLKPPVAWFRARRVLGLLWLALLVGPLGDGWPERWPAAVSVAWAQDDGDDGDDGDDDGGAPASGGGARGPATSRAPGPAAGPGPSAAPDGGGGSVASGGRSGGGGGGSGSRAFQPLPGALATPPLTERDSFLPDELLAINPPPAALQRAQAWGARVLDNAFHPTLGLRVVRLRLPPGLDARTASELAAERDPGVFELHRLYRLEQGADPAPCGGGDCDAGQRLGWPAGALNCGAGQVVGMVDTEVQADHPALRGARLNGRRFLLPGQAPADGSHGTAVAALLAGQARGGFAGLLPRARLLAAAPFYQLPSGTTATDAAGLVKSLDWLVAQGARVIGMSLSGPPSLALQTALALAQRRGVLVAAAAGNGGQQGQPVYPAAVDGVLGVTALGPGNRIYWRANQGEHVDYALPGVDIATPDATGVLRPRSGTSYAVPFLVAKVSQSLSEGRLRPSHWVRGEGVPVLDLGDAGRDPVFGWGLPQVPVTCR